MRAPVRFIVEVSTRGHLVARGIDADVSIEAETLGRLEQKAREVVLEMFGAERGAAVLVGARPPPPRGRRSERPRR